MKKEIVTVCWTWEDGRIWANCSDGRRIPIWLADPPFACFVDLLNAAPALAALLVSGRGLGISTTAADSLPSTQASHQEVSSA